MKPSGLIMLAGAAACLAASFATPIRQAVAAPTVTQSDYRVPPEAHCDPRGAAPEEDIQAWIAQALEVMGDLDIPGTRDSIRYVITDESGGQPAVMNCQDINWRNGVPSIGLMQVIQPTFDAHHCPGTRKDLLDPVANICAASHYAQGRYGSIDAVAQGKRNGTIKGY